jgi:hypothetical protein
MDIELIAPLARGWERMKRGLFKPFDLGTWFTVGFTAFLADLAKGGGGGGGNRGSFDDFRNIGWREILDFPYLAWEWLIENPLWLVLAGFGLILIIALMVVLLYVSSRGQFMFLDNVVRVRAQVTRPWREFRRESHSLFRWRLGFITVVLLPISYTFRAFSVEFLAQFGDEFALIGLDGQPALEAK